MRAIKLTCGGVCLLVCAIGLALGCGDPKKKQNGEEAQRKYTGREYEKLRIPSSLWDHMQAVYVAKTAKTAVQSENGEVGASEIATSFYPIVVNLREKTRGVLGGVQHQIEFPEGGGILDLAEVVESGKKGTWYLAIEPLGLGESEAELRVFYLGAGREREIDGEKFGSGCQHFMEITSYYRQEMADRGFRVNTTQNRDVTVLAGSYFFVAVKDGVLMVSQLTLTDSRYPDLICQLETEGR